MWGLVVVLLFTNLFVCGLVFVNLHQSRQHNEERAAIASQNIALLLSQNIADEVRQIEIGLLSVNDEIRRQMINGGINSVLLNAHLARLHSRFSSLEGIRATDADGIVKYGVNVPEKSTVSIASDDHFSYLRDHPDAGTIISKPKFGKISDKWTIKIVLRYNNPDGSFAGVISGIVDLKYFTNLFSSVRIGSRDNISLRDSDLGIITRHPATGTPESIMGFKSVSPEFMATFGAKPDSGTFISTSPLDGIQRTASYSRVGNWPLIVQVALSTNDYLVEWRREARYSIGAAAVFIVFSCSMAWMLLHFWLARKAALQSLKENQEKFRAFAEMSSDWFWVQDSNFRFTKVSGGLLNKLSIDPKHYIGKTREEIATNMPDGEMTKLNALLAERQPFQDFEYFVLEQVWGKRYISISGAPLYDDDGQFIGYHGTGKDITARRLLQDEIQQMAITDDLTGLINRRHFMELLDSELKRAIRYDTPLSIAWIDIDYFKSINDTHGHAAGDQVLREMVRIVKNSIRETDSLARLGGDEFVLLMPFTNEENAYEVVERARKALAVRRHDIAGKLIKISISSGIASLSGDKETVETILNRADTSLYRSKNSGRNRVSREREAV